MAKDKPVPKRDVDAAAAEFLSAQIRYGNNNMATQRAEMHWRELKRKWDGQKQARAKK